MGTEDRNARKRLASGSSAAVLVAALLVTGASNATARDTGANAPTGGDDRLRVHEETGVVGFIGTAAGRPIESGHDRHAAPARVAEDFLAQRARDFGLHARGTDLVVREQHRTVTGGWSVRLGQEHDGVPVYGGEFTVNLDDGRDVLSVLGEASPIDRAATTPTVTARAAAELAIARVSRSEGVPARLLRAEPPELTLYDPRLLDAPDPVRVARLAWVTEVRASSPVVAHTVVVDARGAGVSLDFSTLTHDRDRHVCDHQNVRSDDPCTEPVWTEGSQPHTDEPDVEAAFAFMGDTYDFYAERFGRDSIDDAGRRLVATVDYCPGDAAPNRCPWRNASWNGRQVSLGDGYAVDDVVAHEFTHGFISHTSDLFYYRQSGAINESMADVFAEFVDLTNSAGGDSPAQRWLHGEDLPGGTNRHMADPPALGDPDRMGSPLYHTEQTDNGGVHTNSGVGNKAAYLLTDGDTFNGETVAGLGIIKAARLFYTVNTDMLVSGSDYADLADALTQACHNLATDGTDGFIDADCTQVEKTVAATEMYDEPAGAAVTRVAPCPPHEPVATIRFDDLEGPLAYSPQTMEESTLEATDVWGPSTSYATSGTRSLYGRNRVELSDTAVRMRDPVLLPEDAFLHFRHAFGFEDDDDGTYDGGVLEYSVDGSAGPWLDAGHLMESGNGAGGYNGVISAAFDNPLGGRDAFVGESYGYGASRVDLTSLAGESVMFRWRIGTDSDVTDRGWYLDDIHFVTCGADPVDSTAPQTTITKHPAKRTRSRTARFGFSADEAATFRCKLDRKAWRSCTSTHVYRVSRGKHVFSVRAIDEAGNRDPSPATYRWTVRRR